MLKKGRQGLSYFRQSEQVAMQSEEQLQALVAALSATPDNVPLRRIVAAAYIDRLEYDSAAEQYQTALTYEPQDFQSKLGLARAYYFGKKLTQALVVLEATDPHPDSLKLIARVQLERGEVSSAVTSYRQALDLDPDAVDEELGDKLGVSAEPEAHYDVEEGRMRHVEEDGSVDTPLERPKIAFDDVGGMEPVKDEIRMKIILPMENPEMFKAYGKQIGGGILMYGPPGCGKTFLARATAGQISGAFMSIGLHDVLDMWIGNSERNLHEIFQRARGNKPCVLFFDEVDALGSKRSDMRTSGTRHLINQFLQEMDSAQSSNDGVLLLAATNAPWHVDSAFRRPGRFDRVLFVPPPDLEARASILRLLLRDKPQEKIDFATLAKKTEGFSGADLKGFVDLAVEAALQTALKSGKLAPLCMKDLLGALKKHRPTTREWFATAKNYVLYANQGGEYDEVRKYMKL